MDKMNNIDLHIHTNYSDGTFTPKEIVDLAKKNNMKVLSFTDHDTIKGVKEGIEYAKKFGIKVIPGVELSTFSVMEIHILGYNFDINNTKLIETLEDFSQQREERVLKILNELKKYNINIERNELEASNSVGRLHVAKALLSKGYVSSIPEAFDRYLGANGIAYFPSKRITPLEGVALIKQAGGIPVIAHPLRLLQQKKLEDLVAGLKPHGLGGIEAYYNTHDEATVKTLLSIARKNNFIATGGTDFHGANRNIELGSVLFDLDLFTKKKLGLI